MKNLYPGDYRTANSIDFHTTHMGIAAGMGGAWYVVFFLKCGGGWGPLRYVRVKG